MREAVSQDVPICELHPCKHAQPACAYRGAMTRKMQPPPLSALIYQLRVCQHHTREFAHKEPTTVPRVAIEEESWES